MFAIVENLGEILEGEYHIIDMSDEYPEYEGEKKYRVYHAQGFCFDIENKANYNVETDEFMEWDYNFWAEWEDFKPLSCEKAIQLMTWLKVGLPKNF